VSSEYSGFLSDFQISETLHSQYPRTIRLRSCIKPGKDASVAKSTRDRTQAYAHYVVRQQFTKASRTLPSYENVKRTNLKINNKWLIIFLTNFNEQTVMNYWKLCYHYELTSYWTGQMVTLASWQIIYSRKEINLLTKHQWNVES
jgi:hypothetical protein